MGRAGACPVPFCRPVPSAAEPVCKATNTAAWGHCGGHDCDAFCRFVLECAAGLLAFRAYPLARRRHFGGGWRNMAGVLHLAAGARAVAAGDCITDGGRL